EEGMYNEVLAHFAKDGYLIPDEEKGELLEKEKFWLSRECLLRYLRASKWVVATAIHRIEDTLRWRREYGLNDKITAKHVEPEAVTGKEILFGFDTCGRPASYMIPSRQNTTDPALQNEYAVWMMERSIDLMEPGVETVSLLINFAQRARHPNINQARAFLNILQNHYPERLGTALLLNIPFLVSAFMRIIMPFVDPVTRHKVKMNPQVVKDGLYEEDMLMREWWGGNREFEYVHEKYWPALVSSTEERVQGWMRRWRELGGGVGVREW
ncbi:CRAL/TRIO domain-containing protein, partial [Coprinopsis marcescibilis]